MTAPAAPALDFAQLRALLPHGPGMVLLDRVETLGPGAELCAIKTISGGESCFSGLDGRSPIEAYAYPASLVLESFGQAAAVLWLHGEPPRQPEQVLMFVAAKDCRFSGQAYPGDVLRHVVRLEHRSDGAALASGHSCVAARRIATYASLTAVVRPRSALAVPGRRAGPAAGTAMHSSDPEGAVGHG